MLKELHSRNLLYGKVHQSWSPKPNLPGSPAMITKKPVARCSFSFSWNRKLSSVVFVLLFCLVLLVVVAAAAVQGRQLRCGSFKHNQEHRHELNNTQPCFL